MSAPESGRKTDDSNTAADRYQSIRAVEDLGLDYPPHDRTDDLVRANESALGSAATEREGCVPNPIEGIRTCAL